MLFVKELNNLGLTQAEAKLYANLIRFGDASATELAKRTDLGRTNIYEYANSLMKKGLVSEYEKKSKIYFRADDPHQLRELANQRLRQAKEVSQSFSEIYPNLEDLYNINISKPTVNYYNGTQGHKEVYERFYIQNKGNQAYILTQDLDSYTLPEPRFRNTFLRKNIFTNLIANTGKIIGEYQKRDEKELRKTSLVPQSILPIGLDMMVNDEEMIFGNLSKDNFSATLIRDNSYVKLLNSLCSLSLRL